MSSKAQGAFFPNVVKDFDVLDHFDNLDQNEEETFHQIEIIF